MRLGTKGRVHDNSFHATAGRLSCGVENRGNRHARAEHPQNLPAGAGAAHVRIRRQPAPPIRPSPGVTRRGRGRVRLRTCSSARAVRRGAGRRARGAASRGNVRARRWGYPRLARRRRSGEFSGRRSGAGCRRLVRRRIESTGGVSVRVAIRPGGLAAVSTTRHPARATANSCCDDCCSALLYT